MLGRLSGVNPIALHVAEEKVAETAVRRTDSRLFNTKCFRSQSFGVWGLCVPRSWYSTSLSNIIRTFDHISVNKTLDDVPILLRVQLPRSSNIKVRLVPALDACQQRSRG